MDYKKILNGDKKIKILAIVFVIIIIALIGGMVFLDNKRKNPDIEAKDYNELIYKGEDKENEYVYFTIVEQPYEVATKETDSSKEHYYIVFDENDSMYLVRLKTETAKRLTTEYEMDKENFSYTFKGFLKKTPIELRDITIKTYNKWAKNEVLSLSNFSQAFGTTYMDETKSPYSTVYGLCVCATVIAVIAALTSIIIDIISTLSIKKILRIYDRSELEDELESDSVAAYPKAKIYLTNKYIISNIMGLKIMKYSDIAWIYNQKHYYNGVPTGIKLLAYNKAGKCIQIASTYRDENLLNEIIFKIQEKNKDVLVGFTSENGAAFKEIKKEYKNK